MSPPPIWPCRAGLANTVLAEICRVSPELVRSCRKELEQSGRIERPERVTGRDGKDYPAQMEHEPRGKTEEPSSEKQEGGGGGGGGRPAGKGDGGAEGGSNMELEREARAMMRRGEMNPFELSKLMTANAHDYASVVINLLGTMRPDDPKRNDGLLRIKRWIDRVLSGEIQLGVEQTWSGGKAGEATHAAHEASAEMTGADDFDDEDGNVAVAEVDGEEDAVDEREES